MRVVATTCRRCSCRIPTPIPTIPTSTPHDAAPPRGRSRPQQRTQFGAIPRHSAPPPSSPRRRRTTGTRKRRRRRTPRRHRRRAPASPTLPRPRVLPLRNHAISSLCVSGASTFALTSLERTGRRLSRAAYLPPAGRGGKPASVHAEWHVRRGYSPARTRVGASDAARRTSSLSLATRQRTTSWSARGSPLVTTAGARR